MKHSVIKNNILMNSTVISRLVLFVSLSTVAFSLEAMIFNPLSAIERMLVVREIQKRGAHAVRQEVGCFQETPTVIYQDLCGATYPIVLHIGITLKKEDCTNDELAKAAFEKIQEIESLSGYRPGCLTKTTYSGHFRSVVTNYLGPDTRYYWLEKNATLHIEANLTNRTELKEIIAGYK